MYENQSKTTISNNIAASEGITSAERFVKGKYLKIFQRQIFVKIIGGSPLE